MRQAVRVLVIALALSLAAPALAQQDPQRQLDEAAELMRQATERLLLALRGLIAAIPQYEAPEILPNGDIIIRRKPPPPPEPQRDDRPKETRT